ncbi:MAG TPA: methylated-DNA--[protein]-cysteine S-methyltransferase [Chloroflexota bacterium]|jgi:O-6-methylguanine DNA methyltransferase
MNAYLDTTDSPAGPLSFAVDEHDALLWLTFHEGRYERTIEEELARVGHDLHQDRTRTAAIRLQLEEYCAGTRRGFDFPLALVGTPWQKLVWRALIEIPFGQTRTYAQVAAMIGRPTAARAMGRANATNRIPLVIPCHRVIGADGSLTGFGGGIHLKTRLLAHEARHAGLQPLAAN